jgi:membrane protein required for colicin V production
VVSELIALAAWVLAFMAALEFGAQCGQYGGFSGIADPAIRALAGCALVFVGVLVAMSVVRLAVRSMVKALGLSLSDRLLGMFFGLARGLLVMMVLVAAGGMTSAPQQPWWKQATLAPPLETAVLAAKPWLPDDLAKRIRFS